MQEANSQARTPATGLDVGDRVLYWPSGADLDGTYLPQMLLEFIDPEARQGLTALILAVCADGVFNLSVIDQTNRQHFRRGVRLAESPQAGCCTVKPGSQLSALPGGPGMPSEAATSRSPLAMGANKVDNPRMVVSGGEVDAAVAEEFIVNGARLALIKDHKVADVGLGRLTLCVQVLHNGSIVVGQSIAPDQQSYSKSVEERLAVEDAQRKVEALLLHERRVHRVSTCLEP